MEEGKLIAVIGDEDTVTGFLLAGVGHRNASSTNFLVVKSGPGARRSRAQLRESPIAERTRALSCPRGADTPVSVIESSFNEFTSRDDVGIVLINQHVRVAELLSLDLSSRSALLTRVSLPPQIANEIRHLLKDYTKTIPTVLEMPSKDQPCVTRAAIRTPPHRV